MLAHRGCRCYGNWYGRKCELYKNSGTTSQMWLERDCVIFPGGICLCHHSQSQTKCEQVHQNHKVTSHTHRTTSSSKLAMTTNKPNPIVYLTTKHSAILAPSVTSSTTTAKFSAAASASTTPAAPLPSSFKVTTSTVPATSRAMTSKSTAASTKATPTTTIPTTAPVTSVFVPTISNSTRVSVQNVSTSIVTTTITLPPSSQSTSTKPAKIQNTPSVSSNGKTVLPPTKLPSVTSVLPSVSTNPPPKTLPPVSTVCAVCSGPAFLCEKLYAPTECHPPNNYCINTIVNHKDGSKSVNRTCGNFDTCYREWFLGSSDNDKCRKLSASDEQRLDFQCTFCCVEDNCNTPLHPSDRTLYKPTK
ncbi:hepatitis A virus cellular receptor 1-like [Mercenaria mercenaria]|uniref:hepatitis A virus cellular receptor 1-like n=1 Tax=Mercenaria mercenaria TaxID=6596 RepID=UPI00234F4601|nr:hepatitis A virus cellular receptor 1-like [Mercenaria mercenaria]